MYTIYRILNKINDKVYIGQTKYTLKRRFAVHCDKNSGCIKLRNAILKHGKENFWIEPIQQGITNPDTACLFETFWIEAYDSVDNGYNICPIGNLGNTAKRTEEQIEKQRFFMIGNDYAKEKKWSNNSKEKYASTRIIIRKEKLENLPNFMITKRKSSTHHLRPYIFQYKGKYFGCFSTLEEAKQFRDNYLKDKN